LPDAHVRGGTALGVGLAARERALVRHKLNWTGLTEATGLVKTSLTSRTIALRSINHSTMTPSENLLRLSDATRVQIA